jgi:hypothetical protein
MKRFCFHDWGKWSDLVNAYSAVFQFRQCKKCGKSIKRRSGCSNDHNLAVWKNGEDK